VSIERAHGATMSHAVSPVMTVGGQRSLRLAAVAASG
jgi:hypothetical protein